MSDMNGFSVRAIRGLNLVVLSAVCTVIAVSASAQTTTPGSALDLELYNPGTGSNIFCVSPGETFQARLWISPGSSSETCSLSCGAAMGGSANLATAVIDIEYPGDQLSLTAATNSPNLGFAAIDGLIQDNSDENRIGWALAGDWTPNADTSGALASPCDMQLLSTAGWVLETQFSVHPQASGMSSLHLRRETDSLPFALSFADLCNLEAMTQANGTIDEVVDGIVIVTGECANLVFLDNFENGNVNHWSSNRI